MLQDQVPPLVQAIRASMMDADSPLAQQQLINSSMEFIAVSSLMLLLLSSFYLGDVSWQPVLVTVVKTALILAW